MPGRRLVVDTAAVASARGDSCGWHPWPRGGRRRIIRHLKIRPAGASRLAHRWRFLDARDRRGLVFPYGSNRGSRRCRDDHRQFRVADVLARLRGVAAADRREPGQRDSLQPAVLCRHRGDHRRRMLAENRRRRRARRRYHRPRLRHFRYAGSEGSVLHSVDCRRCLRRPRLV